MMEQGESKVLLLLQNAIVAFWSLDEKSTFAR